MARPRVPDDERINRRPGDPRPVGSSTSRRAKAALRANERLTGAEQTAGMALTRAQLKILDRIASGKPVKNAREVLGALRLKADFGLTKPVTDVRHALTVYQLVDPYNAAQPAALPVAVDALLLPAAPEPDQED